MEKYADILHLSPPVSEKRAKMTNYDRAAQFSPFAALTGFEAAIAETGRLTDARIELDEGGKDLLEEQMQSLLEVLPSQPRASIPWFCRDLRKSGGSYVTSTGYVKKVDAYCRQLLLTDGQSIPLDEIFQITLEK